MTASYADLKAKEILFIEEVSPKNHFELLAIIPDVIIETMGSLFDSKEFVAREIGKAFVYYEINPIKRPRNRRHWIVAIMRWLENAWLKSSASEILG